MLETVRGLTEDVAKVAASPLWSLSEAEVTEVLQEAHRLEHASATLRARLAHQAASRDLPASQHHRTTAGWLRDQLRLDPRADRLPEFIPPVWIDPEQRPRRNLYHPRT